jgi:hypothetical protein
LEPAAASRREGNDFTCDNAFKRGEKWNRRKNDTAFLNKFK